MIGVLGIDPGVRGGLAVVDQDGVPVHTEAFQPGMTQAALISCVRLALYRLDGLRCDLWVYHELVGTMPHDGRVGANTFGRVDGLLRGAVLMWIAERGRGQVREAPPMIWQSRMDCLSGGDKNVTKAKALELFGSRVKVTHGVADALLIAEFGRRSLLGIR